MVTFDLVAALLAGDRATAERIGTVIHIGVMGTVMFGIISAALFVVLDDVGALTGVLLGLAHGVAEAGGQVQLLATTSPTTPGRGPQFRRFPRPGWRGTASCGLCGVTVRILRGERRPGVPA